jgi:transcriptional regulator with XRE-family HTH domain
LPRRGLTFDYVRSRGEDPLGVPKRETIGERLRRLRLERGLSQRELSERGVSYAYISRIEAGARRPSVKALRLLAKKLGVSADYLETGSEIRDVEERELRLADAELRIRLGSDEAEAAETLRAVLAESLTDGDAAGAGRARIALGFAAARRGDHTQAVEWLEEALGETTASAVSRPDVYSTLGRSYAAIGEPERAVDLFETCLQEVHERMPHDAPAHARFATDLSYALSDMGELDRAQAVLQEAVESSQELADPYTRVRLCWSFGRLAAQQDNPMLALDCFRRAVALLEATEDTIHLARTHISCAWTLITVGRADEAGPHLDAAEGLFGSNPDPLDRAYLRTEQARHAARTGNGAQAVRFAEEALAILGDADPGEQGSAQWALAEGLALEGEPERANDAFRLATEQLAHHGQRRAAVEALRAWAKLLRETGRSPEAFDVENRADKLAAEPVAARAT